MGWTEEATRPGDVIGPRASWLESIASGLFGSRREDVVVRLGLCTAAWSELPRLLFMGSPGSLKSGWDGPLFVAPMLPLACGLEANILSPKLYWDSKLETVSKFFSKSEA